MIRITLVELALVATPFLLYFLYRGIVGVQRAASAEPIDETPFQILFLAGSALALGSLVVVVLLGRGQGSCSAGAGDQVYVAPRVVDGEVEPGRCISREEAIAEGVIEDLPEDRYFDRTEPDGGGARDDPSPEASSP